MFTTWAVVEEKFGIVAAMGWIAAVAKGITAPCVDSKTKFKHRCQGLFEFQFSERNCGCNNSENDKEKDFDLEEDN